MIKIQERRKDFFVSKKRIQITFIYYSHNFSNFFFHIKRIILMQNRLMSDLNLERKYIPFHNRLHSSLIVGFNMCYNGKLYDY